MYRLDKLRLVTFWCCGRTAAVGVRLTAQQHVPPTINATFASVVLCEQALNGHMITCAVLSA
jgi:hypothetical protein